MDFFAQQARVRGSSRRLVVLFVLAVVAIVAAIDFVVWLAFGYRPDVDGVVRSNVPLLLGTSVAVVCGIVLSSLYRIASLSAGGKKVAQTVGAVEVPTDTTNPQLRRLRNVIEEVAIAAGAPVPDVYLMADEPGINAFAAGYSASDAAVCVTQGCLDQLNRDELQGVIAHEFSHVLNGDMRLNIRLMGLLFGILVLTVVGRHVIWFGGGRGGRRDNNGGQVWMIGLALIVVGYIGYFFARLIQAAVSRSRESLADVSAVQFTRQTDGIANALKKIAIYSEGSVLHSPHKHEVAHMLFGEADAFSALFATHPPLLQRIRALQPGFGEADLEQFAQAVRRGEEPPPMPTAQRAAQAGSIPGVSGRGVVATSVLAGAAAAAATGGAGDHGASTVDRAAALRRGLPDTLAAQAHDPESALALVLALALSAKADVRQRQLRLLADAFGDDVQHAALALFGEASTLAAEARLPLVAVAAPALKQLAPGRVRALLDALDAVVRVDNQVELDKYCLTRLLRLQLLEAQHPRSAPVDGRGKLPASRDSVKLVYAVVAAKGNREPEASRRAWLLAIQHVFPGEALEWPQLPEAWQQPFENALNELDGLLPAAKELLIQGLVIVVRADAVVTTEEAELLRVICASVHCPMPL
ncbi:MAG: M48 family metallopeptidase [Xanthomonadales bacterium]|nr:M48 family metallopeptidase [Xanthomonadales bacterium]